MGKAAEIKRHDMMDSQPPLAAAAAAALVMEDNAAEIPLASVEGQGHHLEEEGGDESLRTAAAVSTVSSEMEKKQMEMEALQASAVVLYTPGPIVHIFKETTGPCYV